MLLKDQEKRIEDGGEAGLNHPSRSQAERPAKQLQEHENPNTPPVMSSVNQSRKSCLKLTFPEYSTHLFLTVKSGPLLGDLGNILPIKNITEYK